jgi:hypothetical protein
MRERACTCMVNFQLLEVAGHWVQQEQPYQTASSSSIAQGICTPRPQTLSGTALPSRSRMGQAMGDSSVGAGNSVASIVIGGGPPAFGRFQDVRLFANGLTRPSGHARHLGVAWASINSVRGALQRIRAGSVQKLRERTSSRTHRRATCKSSRNRPADVGFRMSTGKDVLTKPFS